MVYWEVIRMLVLKHHESLVTSALSRRSFRSAKYKHGYHQQLLARGSRHRIMALLHQKPQEDNDEDSNLCSESNSNKNNVESDNKGRVSLWSSISKEDRAERAWEYWKALGEPKLIVAPMVDQSELPFRMLCRKYGATAAYSPMLHSRLFAENQKYRSLEFSTCQDDRPLFVQFCSNDPERLLEAAQIVKPLCDYVDINLGCPQRIAKRGNYGAFLMDNLPLVKSLVEKLANNLDCPVSCKIRIFPKLEDTIEYAKMLEAAGCALLAVHGRTRDQKDGRAIRADWNAIAAVKKALRIPVLANGNIRNLQDAYDCLRETGADGVLSAESLLENPALFAGYHLMVKEAENALSQGEEAFGNYQSTSSMADEKALDPALLLLEYFDLCEKYPVPWRMVRAHVHRMLGSWFRIYPDLREELNKQQTLTLEWLRDLVNRIRERDIKIVLHHQISTET